MAFGAFYTFIMSVEKAFGMPELLAIRALWDAFGLFWFFDLYDAVCQRFYVEHSLLFFFCLRSTYSYYSL